MQMEAALSDEESDDEERMAQKAQEFILQACAMRWQPCSVVSYVWNELDGHGR